MGFKNIKRSAFINPAGFRVNCDGTTIKDRKPRLGIMPNHKAFVERAMVVKSVSIRHSTQKRLEQIERKYERINPKAVLARARLLKEYEAKSQNF